MSLGFLGAALTAPFEQVRQQIIERLTTARHEAQRAKYLQNLRKRAVIEWKDADLKKLYDQQVADQAAGTKQPAGTRF